MAASGYLELDMPDAAAQELAHIPAEHQGSTDVIVLRLSIAMTAKNWPQAAELARHLVTIQPEEPSWWINLAYSVRRCESLDGAETILLRALAVHPKEVMVYFNLACYAAVTGRISEATERLKEAISLDPHAKQMALEDDDLLTLREVISTL